MAIDSIDYEIAPELGLALGFDDLVGSLRAIADLWLWCRR